MPTWLLEKTGIFGGFVELSKRYGDEKGDATHVRLTLEEYDKLNAEIASVRRKLDAEKRGFQDELRKINDQAVAYKRNADIESKKKVEAANARAEAAEAERDRQAGLNQNLIRITKERANAKRGLQPKKEHPGYRFSGKIMQTKAICGHDKKIGAIYADVWTATLETPYDGTIPICQVEDRIFADLMGEEGILRKLSINYWTLKDNDNRLWKGTYAVAMDDDNPGKENYLFDYKFMVNPKTRLWEIQITTTQSILPLAEMMA